MGHSVEPSAMRRLCQGDIAVNCSPFSCRPFSLRSSDPSLNPSLADLKQQLFSGCLDSAYDKRILKIPSRAPCFGSQGKHGTREHLKGIFKTSASLVLRVLLVSRLAFSLRRGGFGFDARARTTFNGPSTGLSLSPSARLWAALKQHAS